ncbi:MAG: DUF3943 domain-containing protein [Myxococcales bacterium]|nr:DUF3943 domain-containing protein [Myxococcales bacterium]
MIAIAVGVVGGWGRPAEAGDGPDVDEARPDANRTAAIAPALALASGPAAGEVDPVPGGPWPRDRHWLRMLAADAVLFAAMEAYYWSDYDANKVDFAYAVDWRNVRARFVTLDAWRFDDNMFDVNAWRHPAQGATTYLLARSNGFSALEAYSVALVLSGAWELLGEFRETVSLNDLIMTPRAGAVIGESFSQLGVFFLRSDSNWFNLIAGNALSGGRGLLDSIDRKPRWRSRRLDSIGLDDTLWHRFRSYVAAGAQQATGAADAQRILRVGLETEVIMIPDFERPGRATRLYKDSAFSRVQVEATWGEHVLTDFKARARAGVIAWHRKDISAATGDGYNLIYGLASAYEYGFHASTGRAGPLTKDRLAIAHIIGPMVDVVVYRAGIRGRAAVDVLGNFGFVRNYAIDEHRRQVPDEVVRSTILRDNYHHAVGVTGRGGLAVGADGLEAGIEVQFDLFRSIQGADRYQEDIVDDYALLDSRSQGRFWVAYGAELRPDLVLEVELAIEARVRSGTVKATTQSDQEQRYLGGVRLGF